ncbi:DUF3800 domain-containing protein [Clavibacter michiganensis]|uniref:DUF3800 domain-containing protein n=1 Tax=Clavibacter michiganensis TaxID=28447 RepID=UPI0013654E9D|nr:DUF3800 domain-containing protein [Clavibacter michiganensis]MDO4030255.1 DUF3800 domain-containing protein [Clavibacter michiganensis]MDO4045670.1 DUF3800 domain-containing protein [Clavibacter michiganensis]MDO4054733.1 DUF3800 domain-containing protein [Clavibacter michiganensis]MWJ14229.1 hypothetical protein [Clavibacter michiganensis subsp. michiganensis]UOW05294.1 DUF3800 domain-containing protein [Clavibacter michiganensis subsp. michiganensis]
MTRIAFVDESGSQENRDPGTYILAAAICDEQHLEAVRDVMHGMRLKKVGKVHWHEESDARRLELAGAVADLELEQLVVVRCMDVGEPLERRRRKTLERLLYELSTRDVAFIVAESRGSTDDRRDRDHLDTLRASHALAAPIRLDHRTGPTAPALWVADIVCGAVVQDRVGNPDPLAALGGIEIITVES